MDHRWENYVLPGGNVQLYKQLQAGYSTIIEFGYNHKNTAPFVEQRALIEAAFGRSNELGGHQAPLGPVETSHPQRRKPIVSFVIDGRIWDGFNRPH
jgi:hypothetical protein